MIIYLRHHLSYLDAAVLSQLQYFQPLFQYSNLRLLLF